MQRLLVLLAWIYWKINLPFVAAFAETALGYGEGKFKVDGKKVAQGMDDLMHASSTPVFLQFVGTLALLPLYSPPHEPRGPFMRGLVTFLYGVKSFFSHPDFLLKDKAGRTKMVEDMLACLNQLAPEEEHYLVKTIVTTTLFKWALAMAYLDLPEIWDAMGYKPYIQRSWEPPSGPELAKPPRTESGRLLHASRKTISEVAKKPADRTTYVVVGSGAGGAVAARTLQERDPRARIIVLDGGPLYVNDQFSDKAIPTISSVFMNGGVTLSKDQQFIFQQGRTVGGSTVVNNSVAFKPEGFWWADLKQSWRDMGVELDYDDLYHQYDVMSGLLQVQPIPERVVIKGAHTSKAGWDSIMSPTANPYLEPALSSISDSIVRVPSNTKDCIGCGRCNYGCQYDAKLSMLVNMLPQFVANGGLLVPDAQVKKLCITQAEGGESVVTGVELAGNDGQVTVIEADRVILSAGAYASSKLLWRSGFLGASGNTRTVGKKFSVNAGSPLCGVFPDAQGLWAGQQIGFALEIPELRMVVETVSGPPGVIGMTLPNWGAAFQAKLKEAPRMAAVVPVFSTSAYGEVKRGIGGDSGFVLDFALADEDWRRLEKGLKITARAMFKMGAQEIFVNRFNAKSITSEAEIDHYFANLGSSDFLIVQSAHMQGGNIIAPSAAYGVVDEHLKVYGFENLWICDASVIPAPITVNIALTVMALSRYAAMRMPIAA
jgi:choline dehydrogenase-like flavoprotein